MPEIAFAGRIQVELETAVTACSSRITMRLSGAHRKFKAERIADDGRA